jgi:hypothetical protein
MRAGRKEVSPRWGHSDKYKRIISMKDEIISVDEVVASPRGRHIEKDTELMEAFRSLKPWQAMRLGNTFGQVSREDRNKVSHIIRRHWEQVRRDAPRIDFSPEGVPQVRVRDKKAVSRKRAA